MKRKLVSKLIADQGGSLWSSKGLTKQDPLFEITFNPNELKKPMYQGIVNQPSALPKAMQDKFKEVMKDIFLELKQETGAKIEYSDNPQYNKRNVLVVHQDTLPSYALGKTRSVLTEDGTPDTPALLKHLVIDLKNLRASELNNTAEFVFRHEGGHALGLNHPLPHKGDVQLGWFEYLKTWWEIGIPSLQDTIMTNNDEVNECLDQYDDPAIKQAVCGEILPNKYREADKIAIKEQVKKSLDPNYQSPYLKDTTDGISQQSKEALLNGSCAFLSALMRTLVQFYIKPSLIQHYHINNQSANLIGFSIELTTDAFLYSLNALPQIIMAKAANFILTKSFSLWGLEVNNKIFTTLMAAIEGAIKGFPNVVSSASGASLGHQAGWKIVQSLPKIHPEAPHIESETEEGQRYAPQF